MNHLLYVLAFFALSGCIPPPGDLPARTSDAGVDADTLPQGDVGPEPDTSNPVDTYSSDDTDQDTDDTDPDVCKEQTWFLDVDNDGYGTGDSVMSCDHPDDGLNYALESGDCNDDAATAYPTGSEIFFDQSGSLVDNCSDMLDNDCNGDVDDDDWACQNRDSDDDATLNGIDPLFTVDTDGDGNHDTLCVVSEYVMPDGVWQTADAIYQGEDGTVDNVQWGGFDVIVPSQTDAYGTTSPEAWCRDFTGEDPALYFFRYVSTVLSDGQTPTGAMDCPEDPMNPDPDPDLILMDVSEYCIYVANLQTAAERDPYCTVLSYRDGCDNSIGYTIRVIWDGTSLSD